MLGPIGRVASNALRKRGFVITRPTPTERKFLRSPWKLLGSDPVLFADVYARNRATLRQVKEWASDEALQNSLWRYGVPAEWLVSQNAAADRTGLNDLTPEITTAEILGFLARKLSPLSYLEIGVSVGKTILQIARQTTAARIVGLDIEDMYPVLREQFDSCAEQWSGLAAYETSSLAGPVLKRPKLFRLKRNGVVFDYLSADEFRDDTWKILKDRNFNLIYSDGVHTGSALLNEFAFLMKYDLIDFLKPLAMVWDDLWNNEMQSAFLQICRKLCELCGKDEESIMLCTLHGSYGLQHPVGIFYSM